MFIAFIQCNLSISNLHPSGRSRALISATWILAALFASPILFLFFIQDDGNIRHCLIHFKEPWMWQVNQQCMQLKFRLQKYLVYAFYYSFYLNFLSFQNFTKSKWVPCKIEQIVSVKIHVLTTCVNTKQSIIKYVLLLLQAHVHMGLTFYCMFKK